MSIMHLPKRPRSPVSAMTSKIASSCRVVPMSMSEVVPPRMSSMAARRAEAALLALSCEASMGQVRSRSHSMSAKSSHSPRNSACVTCMCA